MSNQVYRCYVEKRSEFDVPTRSMEAELSETLKLPQLRIRFFNRYDVEGLPASKWQYVINTVLSEPASDVFFEKSLPQLSAEAHLLYVEPLPGQFDMRADSCEQCIQMLLGGERPIVKTAAVYAISGAKDADFEKIKEYLINPLEHREASPHKPDTLSKSYGPPPGDVPKIEEMAQLCADGLEKLRLELELAMSLADLKMVQSYFQSESRDPTLSELLVIDTYWSDHCRHTTFNTIIEEADIYDARVGEAYGLFLTVNGDRPMTLMNIATAAMRHLNKRGELPMLDISDENNACTVRIKAEFDNGSEDWLLFFKNETHNHPTEIEPFGGASTCIGGAIRDPLSGRAYVYQAMRITGSGDPRRPFEETLPGKLPQRKITVTAAEGHSSYGNQIGLATGYVKELYHEGYVAKRMEVGAVVGAAPQSSVRRESPAAGDVVVLLGGRTGRDGIGGATGSSKTHSADTVNESASEVQKGNAPEERKLQRLFRNPDMARLIKRCNDFGAGGVAVAVGEIAEGLEIDLDAIPVKYNGLNGTELAISESQERMAVVVERGDIAALQSFAEAENVEATVIAAVTERKRLVMNWRGQKIVDIDRAFLDTNGAERYAKALVAGIPHSEPKQMGIEDEIMRLCADLNFCSQKGLVERFDSTVGAASVFVPYGGRYALTETQVMAALLPTADVRTASVMAYGFDPHFTEADPFGGSAHAVVESVAKLIASGVGIETVHLSLQEYFPRLNDDAERWGKPLAAMLGAFSAQMGLSVAAIGGKDSMSGSFGELDVPSTLISFAVGTADASNLISPEFKSEGHPVYLMETPLESDGLPDYEALGALWRRYTELCHSGKVLSAWACETGGVYGGVIKMALGNMVGFCGDADAALFSAKWGSIIFESGEELEGYRLIGRTQERPALTFGDLEIPLKRLREHWEKPLEGVFPAKAVQPGEAPLIADDRRPAQFKGLAIARPKAVVPVFPGTNCEYDTVAAIERAGGECEVVLVRNLTSGMLEQSIEALEKAISSAQMIVFPGGFSGGDEPDGAAKFIVSLFRNQKLADAVHGLLSVRDGLILGICNGFQALIKLGLLPNGKISEITSKSPTLTFNKIGRHQVQYVLTRVASTNSPWLSKCTVGEVYSQPVAHGEGRFVADAEALEALKASGQIAFQYADYDGKPGMDILHNPNGSAWAVEGICSADGRVLGKMAHTERHGRFVAKNIPGDKFMPLFEGGIGYFR